MKRALFEIDPELSDYAFNVLVDHGIKVSFVCRGAWCDLIAVPAFQHNLVRKLLGAL